MWINGKLLTADEVIELALRGANAPRGAQPFPTKLVEDKIDMSVFDEPQCEEHFTDTPSES